MGDAIDERVTQFSVDWMLSERETEALHDLLAEVRSERLPCGHLLAELQGEDGGMRWGSAGAGCNATATRDRATPLTPPRSRGWKRGSSEH